MKSKAIRMISLLLAAEILISSLFAAGPILAETLVPASEAEVDGASNLAEAPDPDITQAGEPVSEPLADLDFGLFNLDLPAAEAGKPYSVTLDVYGGEAPYRFEAQGVPAGLLLDETTGQLSGIPEAGTAGNYHVTVTVTENSAAGRSFNAELELQVKPGEAEAVAPAIDSIRIHKIAGYSVGTTNKDGGVAEIVRFNKDNGKFYLVNGSTNPPSIDIVPLGTGGSLMKEKSIDVKALAETGDFRFGDLTSLDINTATGSIAAAVQEAAHNKNGKILVMDYDGNLLQVYEAGVQPDMVKYTADGRYILTADEGEPRVAGDDPEGSVSIVDTQAETVTHVKFNDPSVIDDFVHIRGAADADGKVTGKGTKAEALHDLEPEYIALSGDERTAYVSLQENNAIAVVDIPSARVTAVRGLGTKDFSNPRNALDLVNDGAAKLENVPFYGMYMPDGIASYTVNGQTYLLTANEGDATEWPGRENGSKISKLSGLNPDSAAGLFLQGSGTTYDKVEVAGDMGNEGAYLYGGRSFSLWNAADMSQVYDSGSDFEVITAERLPDYFNASNSKTDKDDRSPKKGPEPEYVAYGKVGSKSLAFIGLERIGGVMTYDITDPGNPVFVNYFNSRDFAAGLMTDTGPEGMEFIPAGDSPTGRPLLLVANEVGGSVAVLELNVAKVTLDKISLSLVAGGAAEKLVATVESPEGATGVQWNSSNPAVAAVDQEGNVTPVSAGQSVITALSEDGYGLAESTVTVSDPGQETWKLTVMHTNDTHAHLAEVARRSTLVKQIRGEGGNSLLLDAGDVFSGDLYFTKWQGMADLVFMNYLGYDAMTFGNHEFDKGTAVLADFVRKAQFPLVSSNIDFSKDAHMAPLSKQPISIDSGLDGSNANAGVYPYVVLEVDGHRVGVFGMTTEDTKETSSPGKDVNFRNADAAAEETVHAMQKEGIDIIIGLSHLGYARDKKLADTVEGIDLIVGGHTHTKLEVPEIVTDEIHHTPTVIVQANEWGKFLGRVDLVFDGQGNVLTGPGQTGGGLITVDGKVEEDAVAKEKLAPYNEELEELKKQVVGIAAVVLDGERKNVRAKETNLGNLIADGMLAKAKQLKNADIALMNGGGIRVSIDQGDITMGELRTVMPFGNTLYVLDVTGKQLKDGLENGISGAKLSDLPGKFPQIAGMKFKWDPAQAAGNKVFDVQIKRGQSYVQLDLNATYRLATNSFVANGGDGYFSFAQAIEQGAYHEDLGYPDYEIFMEHVKTLGGTVEPKVEGRIIEQAKPADGGGEDGGSSPGTGSGNVTAPGTAAPSESDGEEKPGSVTPARLSGEQLQLATSINAAGQSVTRVSVNSEEVLKSALEAATSHPRGELTISIPKAEGGVEVQLPAQTLTAGFEKGKPVTLVIESPLANYRLPLQTIEQRLRQSIADGGSGAGDTAKPDLTISIMPITSSLQRDLNLKIAALGGITGGDPGLEFRAAVVSGGREQVIDFGGNYISRIVPLPATGSLGTGNAVAVRYDHSDGKLYPVPALSTSWNGKPALELKSPQNGVFMIIGLQKQFSDVQGHWAEAEIEAMASKLIVQGTNDSNYAPGENITRAEFTALLVRSLGLTPAASGSGFRDVPTGSALADEIGAAVKSGLAGGKGADGFMPDESISRAEMAVMIARAIMLLETGTAGDANTIDAASALSRYSDSETIPSWAASSAALLAQRSILQGDGAGKFSPAGFTTRAEAAVVLLRMMTEVGLAD
ncbi:choice-of-anchor I family protein [Fontibacillus sp. BL9]|uniref:choice-of-anchor I family protein n=1 Tax=Fontibacillus sp. BL9 TaxID=3389971 RepID=UPI00397BFEA8